MKIHKILLPASLLLTLAACSEEEASFELFSESATLEYNSSTYLMRPMDGVEWESSNPFVASVREDGYIYGEHVGEADITAKRGTETLTCHVIVTPQINIEEQYRTLPIPDLPILTWGASRSEVESSIPADYTTYNAGSGALFVYKAENDSVDSILNIYSYSFDEQDGLCAAALGIGMAWNYYSSDQSILDFYRNYFSRFISQSYEKSYGDAYYHDGYTAEDSSCYVFEVYDGKNIYLEENSTSYYGVALMENVVWIKKSANVEPSAIYTRLYEDEVELFTSRVTSAL